MKIKTWLFGLLLIPLSIFAQPFIIQSPNHLIIGNDKFQWSFRTDSCTLLPSEFTNKISNRTYDLSGPLFALSLTWPGEGITPPAELPQLLTAKDFTIDAMHISQSGQTKQVQIQLSGQGLKLIYLITVQAHQPWARVHLKIRDEAGQYPFLEKISVLKLRFKGLHTSLGGFGQPVYGTDLFMGIEFPAAYSDPGTQGRVDCWHYAAQAIPQTRYYTTHSAVIGAAPNGQVQPAFYDYIKTLRPRVDKPFVLYNTWYDIRQFNYTDLLQTIHNFKAMLIDRYHLKLDAFVIDDGWDDLHSVWEINQQKFPQGFKPLVKALKNMHSALGLWISPWNGYDQARNERIKWAEAHGFKPSAGRHLCLGDTAYFNIFKQKVLQYQKENALSFYKIDGFLSVCNETNHNHLPGIYSRELLTRRFIDILKALKKQNPSLFIDITVGTWLSPWWLQWADAVWMTGADFGHADDVPAFSERDKAITFRDYTLYKDFVSHRYQFPLANVMTHGIIKGKLNLLGGKNETLQNWMDNAVMYFSRGVMMWELYLSPQVLSRQEWDVLATVMKWANAHSALLSRTEFIGGNPYQRQIYGYVHRDKEQALLILRNPFVRPQSITLTSKQIFGHQVAEDLVIDQLYPMQTRLAQTFGPDKPLSTTLQGYEVRILRLAPQNKVPPLPTGVSLLPLKVESNKATFDIYASRQAKLTSQFVKTKYLKRLLFNGKKISPEQWAKTLSLLNESKTGQDSIPLILHLKNLNQTLISGSLIPTKGQTALNGRLGILLDLQKPLDSLALRMTCANKQLHPLIKKSANGLWYWILLPKQQITAPVEFMLKTSTRFPRGQLSFWELGQIPLKKVGRLTIETRKIPFDTSAALPVQATFRRVTRCLYTMQLNNIQ